MWRFKPFMHKEQAGLEGRVIDIGDFKVQIRNPIAEGGFSCVYLARDALHGFKQYALKHIICNDEESQELVMKEISVMKTLKGHPNVVTLHAHAIFDMARTKEAFLLMEYCEKSLVNVLESRGAGFFEEKQVLVIFRDVCNAVFSMHCQTPPIAHRDLKAENLLLGTDGPLKLCDFGSTSTNHKRFEKPEEMGVEEDNIRKHTTPAYRSPEMWDLFRREIINEKVDIWALGCLLFRICYLKSAFNGESKLQVLNGNYRIPDLPKYSPLLTDLIRDMLQSSPDDRPDITQVWFCVNALLPDGMQKSLPDTPPEMLKHSADVIAGMSKPVNKSSPMSCRSTPSSEASRNVSSALNISKTEDSTGPLGAFWTSQHANNSEGRGDRPRPKYDDNTTNNKLSVSHITTQKEENFQPPHAQKNSPVNFPSVGLTKDLDMFPESSNHKIERLKQPNTEVTQSVQNDPYNAFIAVFDSDDQSPVNNCQKSPKKEEKLEAEVENLKDQLAHVSAEKAEVTSKYEKLSTICRSQRQEIQDLKSDLATKTPSPSRDSSRNLPSSGKESLSSSSQPNEKIDGTVWELHQGFFDRGSPDPNSQQWQAFAENPKPETATTNIAPKSVRTKNGHPNTNNRSSSSNNNNNNNVTEDASTWGFVNDTFKVPPSASSNSSNINVPSARVLNISQRFGESKSAGDKLQEAQPAGWAGF